MRFLSASILLQASASTAFAATAEQWRSRSIYQIVTDRFAMPNASLPACDPEARHYCGGGWRGITNQLDYIQGMGFDAIWISPVVANTVNRTSEGDAYHGYWTNNFYGINDNFGSMDDLKGLSSALHSREMYLMLDVNVNNMASNSSIANVSWLYPFMNQSNFHQRCSIDDPSDQNQLEQCWPGDSTVPLPDLNTENSTIAEMLYTWVSDLVNTYNADGVRVDKAKFVRKDFWPEFSKRAGVFTLGEVNSTDVTYAAPYTGVLDSILDYPQYYVLRDAFSSSKGNLTALMHAAQNSQSQYRSGSFSSGAFLENHDMPRLQSLTKDQALVKNAIAWLFAGDGIPIIYYGQEQGLSGAGDPSNREPLWPTAYNTNKPLVSLISSLNTARKAAGFTSTTFHQNPMKLFQQSPSTLAVLKAPMLTLLSNGGNTSTPSWKVTDTGYSGNMTLVDVLTCDEIMTDGDGNVVTSTKGGLPRMLIPQSALGRSGLCGVRMIATMSGTTRLWASWFWTVLSMVSSLVVLL